MLIGKGSKMFSPAKRFLYSRSPNNSNILYTPISSTAGRGLTINASSNPMASTGIPSSATEEV
jgi:hypothetical protein